MAWIDVGIAAVEGGSEIGAGAAGAFDLGAYGLDAGSFGGGAFDVGNFSAMNSILGGGAGAEGLGGLFGLGGNGTLGSVGGSFAGQPGFTMSDLASNAVAGGEGAGGAGVNAAQVSGVQNAATSTGAGGSAVPSAASLTPEQFTAAGTGNPYTSGMATNQIGSAEAADAAGYGGTTGGVANQVPGTAPYTPDPTGGSATGIGDTLKSVGDWIGKNPGKTAAGLMFLSAMMPRKGVTPAVQAPGSNPLGLKSLPSNFQGQYPAQPTPYQAQYRNYQTNPYTNTQGYAGGGMVSFDGGGQVGANGMQIGLPPGGPVEQMSRDNALGQNQMFPQAQLQTNAFSSPTNTPMGSNMIAAAGDTNVDPYTGAEKLAGGGGVKTTKPKATSAGKMAAMPAYQASLAGFDNANYGAQMPSGVASGLNPTMQLGQLNLAAGGGISSLGSYSDGGRLLKGPGDGMSDNIPAKIGSKQPARLADGEFVVPADVVSHLGNGSTDAGAKHLYKMMDKVRQDRTGRKAQGKQINADKYLPK